MTKKKLFASVLCCVLLFGIAFVCSIASASAEVIRQFNAEVKLKPDCSLDVTELITMDFENSKRHGIFRTIPIRYTRYGGNYSTVFRLLSITDEANKPINFIQNTMGSDVNIKIGDQDRYLTGEHVYCIHYSIRRAVNFFDNEAEVYWNGTGNDWPFAIENANVRFYPPSDVKISGIKAVCFVGPIGSTTPGQTKKFDNYVEFRAINLGPGSGLTIAARVPANVLERPSMWQEIFLFCADWWPMGFFPLVTGVVTLWILLPRITDPEGPHAIAVEWNPPKNLSPAEVGTLVDENCDMQDIVSTLIDLAVRGYLQIVEIESSSFLFFSNKDYEFKRISSNKDDDVLVPHENEFLSGLFAGRSSVKLSDLKEKFYVHLPTIRNAVYKTLTDKKLFLENPESVRFSAIGWAIVLGVIGLVLLMSIAVPNHIPIAIGLLVSALILGIAAQFMPARTREGWRERDLCLGFQRFVRLAEKDRIAVLSKDDPTIFGRLLPYAMVLGAADQWAEAFQGLLAEPPSWYVPYGYGSPDYNFSSRVFVHDLGQSMNTMGHTFSSMPTPSSAGSGGSAFSGGFSGGGFGGGGGGSW